MDDKQIFENRKHKHLTLDDRCIIQEELLKEKTFKEIGQRLGKDPSTISKEVRRNLTRILPKSFGRPRNICTKRQTCSIQGLCSRYPNCLVDLCRYCTSLNCNERCPEFEPIQCSKLERPPYVCNGCEDFRKCYKLKQVYGAQLAEKKYRTTLRESRTGINLTEAELEQLDLLITPLIKKGQSLYHIWHYHKDEIPVKVKTLYTYTDEGYFSFRNIHMPRKVRYKKRRKRQLERAPHPNYRQGRTYDDFQQYIRENPHVPVVEMDTVEGTRGTKKVLLTVYFRSSSLLLVFLLESKTQAAVLDKFNHLEELWGLKNFRKVFPVILTDNGSEFKDPKSLEFSPKGKRRTKIFYCDPNTSWQKPGVEKSHVEIRKILPKGSSFEKLTQTQTFMVRDHVNSLSRENLNGRCAFELASLLLPDEVISTLALKRIPPDEVILKPLLLKK